VDSLDQVWPRANEDVRAIVTPEVVGRRAVWARMNRGPHRSVKDQRSRIEAREKRIRHSAKG